MWLKVGIPALVLLGVVAVRVVYYVFWRKHWDRRPGKMRRTETNEVVLKDDWESRSPADERTDHRRNR